MKNNGQVFIDFLEALCGEEFNEDVGEHWDYFEFPPEELIERCFTTDGLWTAFLWDMFGHYDGCNISIRDIELCHKLLSKQEDGDEVEENLLNNKFYQCLLEARDIFLKVPPLEFWA